ncbi:MAG: hypothetical protein GY793_04260 [Proteobacteria bacterium]|nr:hypothetical protein [Pseudomonadota bacterium]
MKNLILIILLFITTFNVQASNLEAFKKDVKDLYESRLKEFPSVELTEQRFQKVISSLENKDKLESIYKNRLEFLSDEHKLKRNEYLSKSIITCVKRIFELSPNDTSKETQETFQGYYRYLYEVSNIDKQYDDLLHIFHSVEGRWRYKGLELFTPTFSLSTSGYSYNPYNEQNFNGETFNSYTETQDAHVFKTVHRPNYITYDILTKEDEPWYATSLSEAEKDDFLNNYKNESLFSPLYDSTQNMNYKNPKTKTFIPVIKLYKHKIK